MSDNPIRVQGQVLLESVIKGTVKSPLVVPQQATNNNVLNTNLNLNRSIYKVRMIANGKTFNMLLPPSVESKHPGRSNPMQLPGLQIKAGVAISKLKIPGFFPIYQHLGVESLTISMSGMFTAYDGTESLSTASQWETDYNIKEGQDSYTSACELYDFAVKNKALIEVFINTSDGSFIPKKSTTNNFRDDQSNIKFKGYIKEFEQLYVRQDRNYYMIKFEIIDLGNNVCKTVIKSDKKKTAGNQNTTSNKSSGLITDEDRKYRSKEVIDQAEKVKALIDNAVNIKEILKELEGVSANALKYKLLLYAESKNYIIDNPLKSLLVKYENADSKSYPIKNENDLYQRKQYIEANEALCIRLNDPCINSKKTLEISKQDITNYINGSNTFSTTTPSIPFPNPVIPPATTPINSNLISNLESLNATYNFNQQRGLINDLKTNNGVLSDAIMSKYANINSNLSIRYTYIGNSKTDLSLYPAATFKTTSGDTLLLIPTTDNFSTFRLTLP